tara:strand:+ start:413 stop:850 length:438 start_codon:yes stop_codon:yes gene_type:complete
MKFFNMGFVFILLVSGCTSQQTVPNIEDSLVKRVERANLAYDEVRLDRAEALFLEIVQDNPTYVDAWLKLGSIYTKRMKFKGAIRCFEEAIKIDQEDGRAWYNLALVRLAQATDALETATRIVPHDSKYQPHFMRLHKKLMIKKN